MTTHNSPVRRVVHKVLHKPLLVMGVDRRLFFLALVAGAVTFNLFYSLLAGLLMTAVIYGFAWSTRGDQQMLPIVLAASRLRWRYDPAKHARVDVRGE